MTTENEDDGYEVKVYVYDLSHGMAPLLSQQILGITLNAIYHTSTVVYSKEHYIDQGMKVLQPGTTKYGTPIEVISLGKTYITEDIFDDFLEELKTRSDLKFAAHNYDLFDNNCNHFTDVLVEFLVGKNLDDRILNLPSQVLNTPQGQMLKQMLRSRQLY